MLKVGLTGGIGSGKSTVATIFEMIGIPVYYSDIRAKELINSEQLREMICRNFSAEMFCSDGTLDRIKMANEVFAHPEKLALLNSIVHPAVGQDFRCWANKQNAPYVIQEAAILIESNAHLHCDVVIVVTAALETRIERVVKRDNLSREAVKQRVRAQMQDDERIKFADYEVIADGKTMLLPQVMKIDEKLRKK